MNTLRGLIFDNIGLKLVALLLAVLVYLNVYTDRPANAVVTFRLQVTGLGDSLSLVGPVPSTVQAELKGTGKQIILLRLTEPVLRLALDNVRPGRFTRSLTAADLALPSGIDLVSETSLSPSQVEVTVDHRITRAFPLAARIDGAPPASVAWSGDWSASPASLTVTGPAQTLAALDSVPLAAMTLAGHRDTVHVKVAPVLPDWCVTETPLVELTVPLGPAATR